MRRQIAIIVLGVLMAASAYAQTPFFDVVRTGTPQQVQGAIDKGADVKQKAGGGYNVLMVAARNNRNPEVLTTLLKAGLDVNAQDDNHATALIDAAQNELDPKGMIMTLLKAGANAKLKDAYQGTALDYARQNKLLAGTDALKALEEASSGRG